MNYLEKIKTELLKNENIKEIDIFEEMQEDRLNSFWYYNSGVIINIEYKWKKFEIMAIGEIQILDKNWNTIYKNGAELNNWLPFNSDFIENDTNLLKLIELWYSWENNNWFSIAEINNNNNDEFLDDWFTSEDIINSMDVILEIID